MSTLKRVFGFDKLRPGQETVISAVLAGRSAAAIFPTGSGKSLCYQLSALHLPHLTLVISPLLALMQDQLAFLHAHGIAAASIDSAQSREQAAEVMNRARSGELKILMISVERLKNERFRNFIAQVPISLLVVDEAHCISEWGHNFRPDYLKLPDYQRQFGIKQVLLLTATATPKVIADMREKFAIAEADVVTTGFYRPNLNLLVEPVPGGVRLPARPGPERQRQVDVGRPAREHVGEVAVVPPTGSLDEDLRAFLPLFPGLQRFREPRFQHMGFVKQGEVRAYAEKLIEQYDVRSGQGPVTIARSMSGGNQQKAIIAREVDREKPLIVAVQPTRGLDVGAIEYIHSQLVAERDKGKAVLLVSLELDEVMSLSDRILVMYEGEIVGELDPAATDVQELGLYMAGAKRMKKEGEGA